MTASVNKTKPEPIIYNFGLALEEPLKTFHGRIVKTLDDLPAENPLKEVALRILTIAIAPIAYPLLGIAYLGGLYYKNAGMEEKITLEMNDKNAELLKRITLLKREALPGWQQQAMSLIRKARFDDPSKELKRLKAMGILTDEVSRKLDISINQVISGLSISLRNEINRDQIKMLMGQALEIQSIYGKDHHVFIHAQGANWLGLNYLVKELHRVFEPHARINHFKFLRAPCKLAKPGTASSIWKTFRNTLLGDEKITNVREYINSKWYVSDEDGETREHLLSADGYYFNAQRYESSLFFLINNSNILGKTDTIMFFYRQIISHYRPRMSSQKLKEIADKVFRATQAHQALCGNLFAICLPKDKSPDIQYRAHPYGVICKCHEKEHEKENEGNILNKLQSGTLDMKSKCNNSWPIPQFRLFTPMLKPDITPIYLLTPHKKFSRIQMKNQIKNIAREIHKS